MSVSQSWDSAEKRGKHVYAFGAVCVAEREVGAAFGERIKMRSKRLVIKEAGVVSGEAFNDQEDHIFFRERLGGIWGEKGQDDGFSLFGGHKLKCRQGGSIDGRKHLKGGRIQERNQIRGHEFGRSLGSERF